VDQDEILERHKLPSGELKYADVLVNLKFDPVREEWTYSLQRANLGKIAGGL
jgi:hypothetical protein